MADPLNPLLTGDALVRHLMLRFPTLTFDELREEARLIGVDLTEPPSGNPASKNNRRSP